MTKKKKPEDLLKMGAPTKYKTSIPDQILEYFDVPYMRKQAISENEDGKTAYEYVPEYLPTVEGFCRKIKISKRTLHDWVAKYPNLAHALERCKAMQLDHLVQHSLNGNYNSNFAKFLAMNISEYREKVENKSEVKQEIKLSYSLDE